MRKSHASYFETKNGSVLVTWLSGQWRKHRDFLVWFPAVLKANAQIHYASVQVNNTSFVQNWLKSQVRVYSPLNVG